VSKEKLIYYLINIINQLLMAFKRLAAELKQITKEPNYFYSVKPTENNFLIWNFMLIGPEDTLYEGGIFDGSIIFSDKYPIEPPKVKFNKIIHPNIHGTGEVCISILHQGTDRYGYEKDYERWNPSHGVDSIMMSIISMLSEPNFESPANIDYSKLWKDEPELYKNLVYNLVAKTQM
jgi:ubiquitin-conjugating enzyme E2 G1